MAPAFFKFGQYSKIWKLSNHYIFECEVRLNLRLTGLIDIKTDFKGQAKGKAMPPEIPIQMYFLACFHFLSHLLGLAG